LLGGGARLQQQQQPGGLFAHLGYKAALALSAVLLLLAVVVAAFIRFPSPAVGQSLDEGDQRRAEADPLTADSTLTESLDTPSPVD
jgi:hypothetical protein